jgi:hypothetical protein
MTGYGYGMTPGLVSPEFRINTCTGCFVSIAVEWRNKNRVEERIICINNQYAFLRMTVTCDRQLFVL